MHTYSLLKFKPTYYLNVLACFPSEKKWCLAIRIHLFSSTYPVQCCGDGYPSSYRARERAKPCTGNQSTAGTAQRDRPFMLIFTPLNFDLPVNLTCVCVLGWGEHVNSTQKGPSKLVDSNTSNFNRSAVYHRANTEIYNHMYGNLNSCLL